MVNTTQSTVNTTNETTNENTVNNKVTEDESRMSRLDELLVKLLMLRKALLIL